MSSLETLRLWFNSQKHGALPDCDAPRPQRISRGSRSLRPRCSHSLSWYAVLTALYGLCFRGFYETFFVILIYHGTGVNGIKEVAVDIVAVFDGHNGAEASEMASKLLLEYFVLHTYFLLDSAFSLLSKTSTEPSLRDNANLLHRWEEIPGSKWHGLHFERCFLIFFLHQPF